MKNLAEYLKKKYMKPSVAVRVIEEYIDDKPYPNVLIYGRTTENRLLHTVCAYDKVENLVIVVTVYHPNPELWIDYRRRK